MSQIKSRKAKQVISGIWKFSDVIPIETIIEVGKGLWGEAPRSYRNLHVRKCSKNQYGISFVFDCSEDADDKRIIDKFVYKVTDKLKRQFGNGFVGYDITNEVYLLEEDTDWIDLDALQAEAKELVAFLNEERHPRSWPWWPNFQDRLAALSSFIPPTIGSK